MQLKYTSIFISLVLLFILSACNSSNVTPSANTVPSTIIISWTNDPEYRKVDTEVIPQNNCGGTAEVESVVERSKSIAHSSLNGRGETSMDFIPNRFTTQPGKASSAARADY